MPNVNGMEMPMKKQSGLLVLEDPSGQQSWALIVNATVEYENDVSVFHGVSPQMKVIATMPPGELLRMTSTEEPGEENAAVYSRLLVHVLREERERYAELEKRFGEQGVQLRKAREEAGSLAADRDADMHTAWQDGAVEGWAGHHQGRTPADVLESNPHPLPDDNDDEEEF